MANQFQSCFRAGERTKSLEYVYIASKGAHLIYFILFETPSEKKKKNKTQENLTLRIRNILRGKNIFFYFFRNLDIQVT